MARPALAAPATTLALALAHAAPAQIAEVGILRGRSFTQTAPDAVAGPPTGFTGGVDAYTSGQGLVVSMTVDTPGPAGPSSLIPVSTINPGGTFVDGFIRTETFATEAALDAAWPSGLYAFSYRPTPTLTPVSFTTPATFPAYPAPPTLDGPSLAALGAAVPGTTLHLSLTPGRTVSSIQVRDTVTNQAVAFVFERRNDTDFDLPIATFNSTPLIVGRTYLLQLVESNMTDPIAVPGPGGADRLEWSSSSSATSILFTPIPAPTAATLLIPGAIAATRRRR